jgi:hypothetical protein
MIVGKTYLMLINFDPRAKMFKENLRAVNWRLPCAASAGSMDV